MPFPVPCRRSLAQLWRAGLCVALLAPARAAFSQAPVQPPQTQAQQTLPQPAAVLSERPVPAVVTANTPDATRSQLTARLDSLARLDTTSAAGGSRRTEVDEIRRRLTVGDFRSGDRFLIQDLLLGRPGTGGDTVIVRDGPTGPVFSLNTWADASLVGVLRSELPNTVAEYERTYVRDPRLRVVPLTRVAIVGGVPRPGYYTVDPDRQITDAITLAGGPGASNQKKGRIMVNRGSKRLYDTKAVQTAIRDGRTLDDLGIRSGDEIRVEEPKHSSFPSLATIFFGISALTSLVYLIRSAYNTN
ncbi:MAG TPA: hypothetical protein VGD56_12245 [Gemmatirosa sp.]